MGAGELVVAGYLLREASHLRVIVETSRNKPIAVEAVALLGTQRPEDPMSPFAVTLPLADPPEGERLIIHVIVYDRDGLPSDVLRRRVLIGPRVPRIIGEDGLMGGLVLPAP